MFVNFYAVKDMTYDLYSGARSNFNKPSLMVTVLMVLSGLFFGAVFLYKNDYFPLLSKLSFA